MKHVLFAIFFAAMVYGCCDICEKPDDSPELTDFRIADDQGDKIVAYCPLCGCCEPLCIIQEDGTLPKKHYYQWIKERCVVTKSDFWISPELWYKTEIEWSCDTTFDQEHRRNMLRVRVQDDNTNEKAEEFEPR